MEAYSCEEGVDQFWGVGDEVLVILEDGVDCKHGVLSDERVTVFLHVSSTTQGAMAAATNQT